MKKKISMLLLMATAFCATTISCDKDDDAKDNTEEVLPQGATAYVGTISVEKNDVQTYSDTNVTFVATVAADNTVSIEMNGVKFAEGMPALNINVAGIPKVGDDFTIASIVPTIDEDPMPQYTLTDVDVDFEKGGKMEVDFTCMGFEVEFNGLKK